jgi:PST family polysaccharide transporter
VFTYVITIILALNGLRYYSLVFQSVLSSLLIFIWNIYHANLKIKLSIGISTFKKIAEYSGYHFAMSIFNYFSRNLDKMIIGKYMGNVNLAQYDRAYKFMLYPVQNITHVITPVLHPILSDYQDKLDDIYNKYLKLLKLLSIIGVFITLVCFWCSGEIILILYGNQWTQAVSIFKWMSLGILSQMLAGTAGAIYQSIGKPKQFFFITVLNTLVICIGIIIGIFFKDLEILSISISVCFNINIFIITFLLIKYGLRKKAGCFYFKFIPDILSLILISALMYFIINFIHIESLILSLLAKTSIIFFSYLLLLCLFRQVHYIRNTGVKYGE